MLHDMYCTQQVCEDPTISHQACVRIAGKQENAERFTVLISSFRRVQYVICFIWVIPRRLGFKSRRFGTLYLFHLHGQVDPPAHEDGTYRGFRNVGF